MSEPGLTKADILGSWRIERVVVEQGEGKPDVDAFGPNPVGYFHYLDDDRVAVVISRGDRPVLAADASDAARAEAARTVACYTGTYKVLPDRLIVHVEACADQSLVGREFSRMARIVDDKLHLRTLPEDGAVMKLVWARP